MSTIRKISTYFLSPLVIWFLLAMPSLAAKPDQGGLNLGDAQGFTGLVKGGTGALGGFLSGIVNLLLGLVGILAVAAIVWGAITIITSAGEEGKAAKGKKAILYAIIGLFAAMASFIIIRLVGALVT